MTSRHSRPFPALQWLRLAATATAALGLAACAGVPAGRCSGGLHAAISDNLYLGTATPSGAVTPDAWAAFQRDVVAARFPRGFTVVPASGHWRSAAGEPVHEASYVLTVIHPDDRVDDAAMAAVAAAYKARFRQDSVLRVRSPACVSF
jgi:hypothetical protein